MGKCKQCGKSSLFLKLKNGYCLDCYNDIEKMLKGLDDSHQKFMSDPYNKFSYEYLDDIKNFENLIIKNRMQLKTHLPIDIQIKLHEDNIKIYEELKNFCYEKGEGGKLFFEKRFEHFHNSQNSDFTFIQKDLDELESIKKNYDTLKSNETKYNKLITELEENILKILKENDGILQKDLTKMFDPLLKDDINNFLWKLQNENRLKKEKQGNSNSLHLI